MSSDILPRAAMNNISRGQRRIGRPGSFPNLWSAEEDVAFSRN